MSYEFGIDFSAIVNAFGAFVNAVATGLATALPTVATVLVGLSVVGLMFALIRRVPIVGEAVGRVVDTIRGVF